MIRKICIVILVSSCGAVDPGQSPALNVPQINMELIRATSEGEALTKNLVQEAFTKLMTCEAFFSDRFDYYAATLALADYVKVFVSESQNNCASGFGSEILFVNPKCATVKEIARAILIIRAPAHENAFGFPNVNEITKKCL